MTIPGRLRIFTNITIAVCLIVYNPGVSLAKEARSYLAGSLPLAGAKLPDLGDLPGTNRLYFALALPLRNQDELNSLLQEVYTLGNTNYHHYLAPGQFTVKF